MASMLPRTKIRPKMESKLEAAKRLHWEKIRRQLQAKSKKMSQAKQMAQSKSISLSESMMRSTMLKRNNQALAQEVQSLRIMNHKTKCENSSLKQEIMDLRTGVIPQINSKASLTNDQLQELQRLREEREVLENELGMLGAKFLETSTAMVLFSQKYCTPSAAHTRIASRSTSTAQNNLDTGPAPNPLDQETLSASKVVSTSSLQLRVRVGSQPDEDSLSDLDVSMDAELADPQRNAYLPNVSTIFEQSFCTTPGPDTSSQSCTLKNSPDEDETIFATASENNRDSSLVRVDSSFDGGNGDIYTKTSLDLIDMSICQSMHHPNASVSVCRPVDSSVTALVASSTVLSNPIFSPASAIISSHASAISSTSLTDSLGANKQSDPVDRTKPLSSPFLPFVTHRRTSVRRSSQSVSDGGRCCVAEAEGTPTRDTLSMRRCRSTIFKVLMASGQSQPHSSQDEILDKTLENVPLSPSIPPPKKARSKSRRISKPTKENLPERPQRQRNIVCYQEVTLKGKMRRD